MHAEVGELGAAGLGGVGHADLRCREGRAGDKAGNDGEGHVAAAYEGEARG